MTSIDKSKIPVVILCGGLGTRLAEETETKPKPMVEVGGKPILWHLLKTYSTYGFSNFILCLGYKGHIIKNFFLNYDYNTHDVRITTGERKKIDILDQGPMAENWSVTLAETGPLSMTGSRVKRIEKYIDSDTFMLTYGDGVCNVNIDKLLEFHKSHGKMGTVTGVRPPSRFGELLTEGADVMAFSEKPEAGKGKPGNVSGLINGGFFVFNKEFFRYLSEKEDCVLEKAPLEGLANDKQLQVYRHEGFWQCMDTLRDVTLLRELWDAGKAPWKVWK